MAEIGDVSAKIWTKHGRYFIKDKERSGAHCCDVCYELIKKPTRRKHYKPMIYYTCQKCMPNTIEINFNPTPDSHNTNFFVFCEDVHLLIKHIIETYNKHRRGITRNPQT